MWEPVAAAGWVGVHAAVVVLGEEVVGVVVVGVAAAVAVVVVAVVGAAVDRIARWWL